MCELHSEEDLNKRSDHFMNVIKQFVNKQTKSIRLKDKSDSKWYNNELREMKKDKNELYETAVLTDNDRDWLKFRQARNRYVNKINYASKMDLMKDIRRKKSDQKGMWKILKSLINNKSVTKSKCIIFDDEEVEVSGENELYLADTFNKFFIDSVTAINKSIPDSGVFDTKDVKRCTEEFKFSERTIDQLLETVKNLKNKRDFEGVNIQFVLDAWDHIGKPLLDIVNDSLRQ